MTGPFLLPDAVAPLRLVQQPQGWTVWDARSLPVLRTPQGGRHVPDRAAAEALIGSPSTSRAGHGAGTTEGPQT